jgi:hypothetical protein
VPLSQLQKRRIQPERYAKLPQIGCKNIKMALQKNLIHDIMRI